MAASASECGAVWPESAAAPLHRHGAAGTMAAPEATTGLAQPWRSAWRCIFSRGRVLHPLQRGLTRWASSAAQHSRAGGTAVLPPSSDIPPYR
eukprot:357633-Chlamydomonas_euryale.AAC.14